MAFGFADRRRPIVSPSIGSTRATAQVALRWRGVPDLGWQRGKLGDPESYAEVMAGVQDRLLSHSAATQGAGGWPC